MSRFHVVAQSELLSPTNGYIYKIQRGFRLPEEAGVEKIRIAYWKHRGQRGFGQYAPILPETELGNLMGTAVKDGVLGSDFLGHIEGARKSKGPASSYIEFIAQLLHENDEFLAEHAKEVYDEVIELLNDAIDHMVFLAKRTDAMEEHSRFAVASFVWHILMPMSYAIYLNLLAANLVSCFGELRILTESLGECYVADQHFPDQPFFQARIELLHQERTSTAKRFEALGKDFIALWGKLSEDWVHTRGIVDKIVRRVSEGQDWPIWTVVVPMTYSEGDLAILGELRKRVSDFRILLARTVDEWKRKCLDAK